MADERESAGPPLEPAIRQAKPAGIAGMPAGS
jgi:hypothetical protein